MNSLLLIFCSFLQLINVAGKTWYLPEIPAGAVGASSITACAASSIRFEPARWKLSPPLRDKPVPTHKWWSSLVWKRCLDSPDSLGSNLMFAYPLAFRARSDRLQIAYPSEPTFFNSNVFPFLKAYKFLFDPFDFQVVFGGGLGREVVVDSHSDFHVSMRFKLATGDVVSTIGRSNPFVLFELSAQSSLQLLFQGRVNIWFQNTDSVGLSVQTFKGPDVRHHYSVHFEEGVYWVKVDGADGNGAPQTTLRPSGARMNYLSIAPLASPSMSDHLYMSQFAHLKVAGGKVKWTYNQEQSSVLAEFNPVVVNLNKSKPKRNSALFAMLPHIAKYVVDADQTPVGKLPSPKGELTVMKFSSLKVSFPYTGILPILPLTVKDRAILDSLKSSISAISNLPVSSYLVSTDSYWTGKQLQKTCDLALIADQLGMTMARNTFVSAIKSVLNDWFDASQSPYFYMDKNAGSLIGFPTGYGSDTDLNDHHFHYGYFIRAAAVVAMFDKQWARQNKDKVDLLVRDTASWLDQDPLFPSNRHFDHFSGHHYASGHAAFGSGNNQESSSEAMNFNAALILWGTVMADPKIRDLGIYMYASESASIMHYWFDTFNNVYPKTYDAPYSAIVWDDGGSYEIFWGPPSPEEVQGINMLPISSTSLYLSYGTKAMQSLYEYMIRMKNGQQESMWKDIIWTWQALYDPSTAFQKFQYDQQYSPETGTTRVATAYWLLNMQTLKQLNTVTKCKTPLCICFRDHAAIFNPESRTKQFQVSTGDLIKVSPNTVNWKRLSKIDGINAASVTNNTNVISCQSKPNNSFNGKCGNIEGQYVQCQNDQCCSIHGFCGQTQQHCMRGCQTQFGVCW